MKDIFGFLTTVSSILVILLGLTRQIAKNWRDNKSGMDSLFVVLVLCMNVFRLIYGTVAKTWYIVLPDCVGLCFVIMLVCQLFSPRLWNIQEILKRLASYQHLPLR